MICSILWGFLYLVLAGLAYIFYVLYRDSKKFNDQGVLYLGNGMIRIIYALFNQIPMTTTIVNTYETIKSKKEKFGVSMDFGKPTYIVTDLDLTKLVLVKDFDHFVNRRSMGNNKNDALLGKMLLALEGDKWKALRSKMSPTFTTGKIRRMFTILDKSGQKMVKFLEAESSKSPDQIVDLNIAYAKYTMDVIASAAFGLDSKAFEQVELSRFERMGDKLQFKFSAGAMIKLMATFVFPKLGDLLGISFFDPEAMGFFSGVIKSAIRYREEHKGEKRDDFLQLMLEARDGQLKVDDGGELSQYEKEAVIVNKASDKVTVDLEDDDIVAQSVLFILGGYDTTQSVLMYSAYNLALYPDLQERLYQEVQKSVEENDGKLTYDSINQMEYMEMFISETLRYYPPGVNAERMCTKDYKIPDSNVTVEKGSIVSIPVFAIHRDAKYYPEPEKFDPERFTTENRAKIHSCAYIPFGYGPRNCIAMRLALVETKMSVAHLVLNFHVQPCERTLIPMKFANAGALRPEGGMPLKLTPRK